MNVKIDFIRVSYFYVGVLVPVSVLIPLLIGALRRVYEQPGLRPIFVYLIVSGVTNMLAKLLGAAHLNNLPLLHIYTIVEFLLLLAYYRHSLAGKLPVGLVWGLGLAFPVVAVLNFLLLQSIFAFNSYPRALASVLIILLSSYYFLTEDSRNGQPQPDRWINFGLLQYFGSATAIFAFYNLIIKYSSFQGQVVIGVLHATLVLIMYALLSVGFRQTRRSG
ncbi:hypothetical protein E5K00_02685 [Hymenobacter aquaticus]|uniref:Uncharacterized protein n=1 Tax=Hymenobacter aquaticus TaxID=1867101 RepID=A0A4Z0Q238_9BACT|nr:hypothetical protein [Hymenobacter aquaticus]TGE24138.1 hypothetical protein E5K00_02685 [Hymenobacter aquaticus]